MIEKASEEASRRYLEAVRAKDPAGCAGIYTEDANFLPAGRPMIHGRRAIQGVWAELLDHGVDRVELTAVDVQEHGDLALEIGEYSLIVKPPDESESEDQGKYVKVWKREADGAWRWHIDIFNSNTG
ncbi:MAG: YybH family protein [Acidimicrobiia bacterium]